MSHAPIPRERSRDNTLALLAEGYKFIARRCAATAPISSRPVSC